MTPFDQKHLIQDIVNVFETGSPAGDYGAVSVYDDGPGRKLQVTYGRSQTTEYGGGLFILLKAYVAANGSFASQLRDFIPLITTGALPKNEDFKSLLRQAGADPVMQQVQDRFFDDHYWTPACGWFINHMFKAPLSLLVIYDSFVHSGQIFDFLRARFPQVPPDRGGDEQEWIDAYVDARHNWLRLHSNPDLRLTIYRTSCFKQQIARGNWDLAQLPINANGVEVSA